MPRTQAAIPLLKGKWRIYEQEAARIRVFANLAEHEPLDPFQLAQSLNFKVISLGLIEGLSDAARKQLDTPSPGWSGVTVPQLADGTPVIILNTRQSRRRQAATLMEEICHLLLGHKPSQVAATVGALGAAGRTYDESIEEEAYAVGAAALVPYLELATRLCAAHTIKDIAAYFGVSQALVRYRIRVLGLTEILC
jgi:hypothetical protein